MKQNQNDTLSVIKPGDKMLRIREAAELTGINEKQIKQAVMAGELSSYVFGKTSTRLRLSDVQAWWKTKISIEKTENDQ
jgi:excisionase family DNA binding protein